MFVLRPTETLFRLVALFSCIVALIFTSLCFFPGIKRTKLDDLDVSRVRLSLKTSSREFLTFVGKYLHVATQTRRQIKLHIKSD